MANLENLCHLGISGLSQTSHPQSDSIDCSKCYSIQKSYITIETTIKVSAICTVASFVTTVYTNDLRECKSILQ